MSMFVLRAVRVINVYCLYYVLLELSMSLSFCTTCCSSYHCLCLYYVLLELSLSKFVLRAVRVIIVYVCSTCC